MSNSEIKNRRDIDQKYKWDIESMFPDEKDWEKDFAEAISMAEKYGSYAGRLAESPATLLKALQEKDAIWQKAEKVYVYARMRRDEDNRETRYQGMADRCHGMLAQISSATAFFTPELLEIPKEKLLSFLDQEPGLKVYSHYLDILLREKEHVLSHSEEKLLAQVGEITASTNDIFTMLNDADIAFGQIKDEDGKEVTLTHGNYINFMECHDREVRKAAYDAMYEAYKKQINTISTTYNYNTKTDVVFSKIRKYPSSLEASLSGDNIDQSVYHNLIKVVNDNLGALHRYINLRKKLLGVDELKMYDVYVPLVKIPNREIPYEEGLDIIRDALSVLGDEYVDRMNKGIADKWIDVYENQGKTSGAYSFGSYDSKPFILLNYAGKIKDVFTIIHEMGHSMHSSYTREAQPFVYGSHSIFTAEVASTVNESLLINYLLEKETDPDMRRYLLNLHIEEFRTTLFRQTMFAEFELLTHQEVEKGGVLTAKWLCDTYEKLNSKYFGDAIGEDDYIKYEWARIPHFYNAYYVYQYATGYSAATAIAGKILSEGMPAVEAYKKFLTTGESDYPVELLKIAGVDMSSPEPVKLAMKKFESLVDEFEKLSL